MKTTKPWLDASGPSAGLVQQHFVKQRMDALGRKLPDFDQKFKHLVYSHSKLRTYINGESRLNWDMKGEVLPGDTSWLNIYININEKLKASELTINFDEKKWFSSPCNYDSYKQMYELRMLPGGFLPDSDPDMNPLSARIPVDDFVTFPKEWSAPALQPNHKGWKPGDKPLQREGFSPGTRGQRFVDKMGFGTPQIQNGYAKTPNKQFMPETKQIFAGLNYARRPSGSSIAYGDSCLVLNPKYKANAIFFAGDTFSFGSDIYQTKIKISGSDFQIPYTALAHLLVTANERGNSELVNAIIDSCLGNVKGSDIKRGELLIEAHIFDELPFDKALSEVRIPYKYLLQPIGLNAINFATKFGANITFF